MPAATSTRATIVLVHGFWGDAAHWAKVITELARQGYTDVRAVENRLTSLADDVERTRKMIASVGGPVLLVGHSYGGAVITQAGNHDNVLGLVYIAAFAPEVGESPASLSQQFPSPGAAFLSVDADQYLWVKPEAFHANFCPDLSADEGWVMGVTQKAPQVGAFGDVITQAAFKTKPSWYQISSEDRMISPEGQVFMAGRLGARKVVTLTSSHASLASRPVEVTALILEAAAATSV